jgi:hypothetical protein
MCLEIPQSLREDGGIELQVWLRLLPALPLTLAQRSNGGIIGARARRASGKS